MKNCNTVSQGYKLHPGSSIKHMSFDFLCFGFIEMLKFECIHLRAALWLSLKFHDPGMFLHLTDPIKVPENSHLKAYTAQLLWPPSLQTKAEMSVCFQLSVWSFIRVHQWFAIFIYDWLNGLLLFVNIYICIWQMLFSYCHSWILSLNESFFLQNFGYTSYTFKYGVILINYMY